MNENITQLTDLYLHPRQVKLNRVCKSYPTIARFANRHMQERMVFFL